MHTNYNHPSLALIQSMQKRKRSGSKKISRAPERVTLKPVSTRYARERWNSFLSQDRHGMLAIEGVSVDKLAEKYGTPLYIHVEKEIRARLRRFKKVFGSEIGLQYAVKCNSNLEILRIVREEGFELDC